MTDRKTAADFFDMLLSDWGKFLRFLLLLGTIVIAVLFLSWAIPKALGVNIGEAQEVQLTTGGIVLRSLSGHKADYVVLVHPQGWQDSGIALKVGDRVTFHAHGSVNIDLEGITSRVQMRKQLEEQVKTAMKINPTSEDPSQVPERYYTDEQIRQLKPNRPWAGPDGNTEAVYTSFAARRLNRMLPEVPNAALIGAVTERIQKTPDRSEAFFIGSNYRGQELQVSKGGELWLSVNDVWDPEIKSYPNIFYDDNIGFFWVNVTVSGERK